MKSFLAHRRSRTQHKGWLHIGVAFALSLCFFSATATGTHPVHALGTNLLTVSGTSTATSSAGSSIAVGDIFNWVLVYDLDSSSTSSSPSYGNTFNDAVNSFTLTKASSNTGTWNPSGITWPITPAGNVFANANGDNVTVQLRPTNAPAIDSVAFFDLGITLDWNSAYLDAVWASGTRTFASWLGTSSPSLSNAGIYLELRDANYSSASFATSLAVQATTTTSSTTSTSVASNNSTTTTSTPTTASSSAPTTTTRITGQSTPTSTRPPGSNITTLPGATTTTTSTLPPTTTLPLEPAPEAAEVEPGMAAALVNGQRVDLAITRQNNVLQIASGNIQMNINVIDESGAIVPLDKDGNVLIKKGSKFEFSVTGAQSNADLEAWLFSDPVKLGNTVVDTSGKASGTLTIANKVPKGAHRFVTKTYSSTGDAVTISIGVIAASGSSTPIGLIIFIVLIAAVLGGLLIPAVRRRREIGE